MLFNKKIIKTLTFFSLYLLVAYIIALYMFLQISDIKKVTNARNNITKFQGRHVLKVDNKCYLTPNDIFMINDTTGATIDNAYVLPNKNSRFTMVFRSSTLLSKEEYYQKHVDNDYTYKIKKNDIKYTIIGSKTGENGLLTIMVYRKDFNLEVILFSHVTEITKSELPTYAYMPTTNAKQSSEFLINVLSNIKPTPCRD